MGYRNRLTEQFYRWERRGRGWDVFGAPVQLEPVFEPFFGHYIESEIIDDGVRPRWWQRFLQRERHQAQAVEKIPDPSELAAYESEEDEHCVIFRISIPRNYAASPAATEQLLTMLALCRQTFGFEIIATHERCSVQFACRPPAAYWLKAQAGAFLRDCIVQETQTDALLEAFEGADAIRATDFGLAEEFMRPISRLEGKGHDPYLPLFGIINHLRPGEAIVLQTLFCGVHNPWAESIMASVTDGQGGSFFYDAPEMPSLAKAKTAHPLTFASVRVAAVSSSDALASSLLRHAAMAVRQASRSSYNEFFEVPYQGYAQPFRLADMILRQSRRLGMALSVIEVATLAHVPSASLSRKLLANGRITKPAPPHLNSSNYILGMNEHQGQSRTVGIGTEQRTRHVHILGGSGVGKSTLLHSLILQDIENGTGCCVIDPHGDLIERVLSSVPPERINDVVLIDPSDSEYPVSLNILSAHSDVERELLASDLVALFRRFSTSWGDNLHSVLANAIMAFLYNDRPGHLGDLRRFLIEPAYRAAVLDTCTDEELKYYWKTEYPLVKTNSIGPILTRLDTFLRPRAIRNMLCQHRGLDFGTLMDGGKIVLVKLSQGLVGAENSHLLGACIVAKLQQCAMARQAQAAGDRVPFFCYIDEFHHFMTESMGAILSGARKFGFGLVLAHQDMQQVQRQDADIAGAIMSNVGTRVCFRLSDTDARRMQEGFSGFGAEDLQNLGTGEAVARVNTADADFSISIMPKNADHRNRDEIVDRSRRRYGVRVSSGGQEGRPKRQEEPAPPPEGGGADKPRHPSANKEALPEKPTSDAIREHRYLQNFIKEMAEQNGYVAHLEVPTAGGKGLVDAVLSKGSETIAVEVSVSTGPKWELHNVQKCLDDDYGKIVVCSSDQKKLKLIKEMIDGAIPLPDRSRILLLTPDQLPTLFSPPPASQETVSTMKGYRVKVKYDDAANDPAKAEIIKRIVGGRK